MTCFIEDIVVRFCFLINALIIGSLQSLQLLSFKSFLNLHMCV